MKFKALRKQDEQKSIEELSRLNKDKRDEINNEAKASRAIEGECNARLQAVQLEMKHFSKLIESEVKKNQDLKTIIQSLTDKLGRSGVAHFKARPKDSSRGQEEGEEDRLDHLLKRKQKLEYDIEQFVQKNNESLAAVSLLREQVKAARSERVIFSGIFKNLEREIRINEEKFKKLIIEKYQVELEKKEVEAYYAARESQKGQAPPKESQRQPDEDSLPLLTWAEGHHDKDEPKDLTDSKANCPQTDKKINYKQQYASALEEIESAQIFFRKLRSEIGYEDLDELVEKSLTIERENEELFRKTNEANEEIDRLSAEIEQCQRELQAKRRKNQTPNDMSLQSSLENSLVHLEEKESELDQKIKKQQEQAHELLQVVQRLALELGFSAEEVNDVRQQNVQHMMAKVQLKLGEIVAKEDASFNDSFLSQSALKETERDRDRKQQGVGEVLDKAEKLRETDKLLTRQQFDKLGDQQIKNFLKKKKLKL